MTDKRDEVVSFGKEIDPAEEQAYRDRIAKAKAKGGVHSLKGSDPLGRVEKPSIPLHPSAREREVASAISDTGGVQARPPGSPLLSPETAAGLQAMAAQQVKEQEKSAEEKKVEEKKKEDEDLFEMFDFGGRNEAERVLNNKKRRQEIETRCAPMSIDDLVMKDEVQQLVPIIPGKFEVLYRSITPDENLFIKRYVASKDQGQNEQYIIEKFGTCQITCSVIGINGRPLPDHRDNKGDVDEKLFEAKLKVLLKKSGYIVADLGINYSWFDIRVRKLLNPDALGNG
jgi:hypothetical protein